MKDGQNGVAKQGFTWVPHSLIFDRRLTPRTKMLWVYISAHCDRQGSCFPSRKYLANLLEVTERQVKRCLKQLKDAGWLTVEVRECKTNLYRLPRPEGGHVCPPGGSVMSPPGVLPCPPPLFATDSDEQEPINNNGGGHRCPPNGKPVLPFGDDRFKEAWGEWESYRAGIKHKLTEATIKKQFKLLESFGMEKAIKSINNSICNGWQGLFEPTENGNGRTSNGRESVRPNCRVDTSNEQLDAIRRKTIHARAENQHS